MALYAICGQQVVVRTCECRSEAPKEGYLTLIPQEYWQEVSSNQLITYAVLIEAESKIMLQVTTKRGCPNEELTESNAEGE